MKILGVIPARYASTRFPGKPLADIAGKTMIQRVYEQVQKAGKIDHVVVATDDARIFDHVVQFGGAACMTKDTHPTGTDRCYEASSLQTESFDYVINIQGDEPFIQPDQVNELAATLDGSTQIATLIKKIEAEDELFNPGEVKVVYDVNHRALYFSRSPIPHLRGVDEKNWFSKGMFYKHIGLYAFRSDILKEVCSLEVSTLEAAESLEQLRWMENGYAISVVFTDTESMCIETPEDLQRALTFLNSTK